MRTVVAWAILVTVILMLAQVGAVGMGHQIADQFDQLSATIQRITDGIR